MSYWDELSNGNVTFTKKDIAKFTERCEKSKPFFSKYICGVDPTPKQTELLNKMNKYQNVVAVFNRQGGKSTIFGIDDAHDLLYKDYSDGHEEWINVYAPVQEQSRLIFGKVYDILDKNPITRQFIERHNHTGFIQMKNGNKMMSKSASPNANIRGDSPTKIQVDESQGVCDKQYYEAIIPSGSATDAKIQEIGTPAGRNHFYKTYHNAKTHGVKSRYKIVIQRWHECPFIKKSYIEEQMENMPRKAFEQEYLCKWDLDEGFAWDYEIVVNSLIMPEYNIPPEKKTPYVAGLDVAKSPAETVLWVAKVTKMNTLQQVYINRVGSTDWPEMIHDSLEGVVAYKPSYMCFDATGIGQPAFDFFVQEVRRYGDEWKRWAKKCLEDVVYTNPLKTEMVSDVDKLLCQNKFTKDQIEERFGDVMTDEAQEMMNQNGLCLSTLPEVKNQMLAFKAVRLESGRIKFVSDKGINNDICNAVMLGVKAHKSMRGRMWTPDGRRVKQVAVGGQNVIHSGGGQLPSSFKTFPKRPSMSNHF